MVLGDEDGYADRSFGNLPEVQTMVVGELNAYDILVNDWVVFTDETLPGVERARRWPTASPMAPSTAEEAAEPTRRHEADADGDGRRRRHRRRHRRHGGR